MSVKLDIKGFIFKGYEWKKIAKADRLWLGRKFLNEVKYFEIDEIKKVLDLRN